jgi:hypothetical protein
MNPFRVMYIVKKFPQISETYIKTEIEAVRDQCEVRVIATKKAAMPCKNHVPFRHTDDPAVIREAIEEFRPHVLHSHWLHSVQVLGKFAKQTHVPFTVRAHSFDSLWQEEKSPFDLTRIFSEYYSPRHIRKAVRLVNDDLCLGILAFPFARPRLERAGIRGEKIVDCFPVINFPRFYDTGPNGDAVMNVGAALGKKKMDDFIELGSRAPHMKFDLYALSYKVERLREINHAKGDPVNIIPPVELEDMPAEYKKHRWLVYTASKTGRVGWPMAVAEAQASGVGVCMANIRPDLKDYVGDAGYLYDSVDEVLDIISKPVPEELRQRGFERARKSDVFEHRKLLFGLWEKAMPAAFLRKEPAHSEIQRSHAGV